MEKLIFRTPTRKPGILWLKSRGEYQNLAMERCGMEIHRDWDRLELYHANERVAKQD